MEKKYIYLMFLSLIAINYCCSFKSEKEKIQDEDTKVVNISLKNIKDVKVFSCFEYMDSVRYIQLETKQESLLGEIKKVELCNDTIIVLDYDKGLFTFDLNGNFIAKIGNEGSGPKEYVWFSTFFCSDNNIVIMDISGQKDIYFNLKGEFVKSVRVPASHYARVAFAQSLNDKLLSFNYCGRHSKYATNIYDINTNKEEPLHAYPIYNCRTSLAHEHPLCKFDNIISFLRPLNDTIYHFDGNHVYPAYILEHKKPLVTDSFVEEYLLNANSESTYFDFVRKVGEQGYYSGILELFETSDFLIFRDFSLEKRVLWSKYHNKGINIKATSYKDIIFHGKMIASTDKCFISIINFNIMQDLKQVREADETKLDVDFISIVDEYEIEDNPILVLAYLNKDALK